MSHIVLSYVKQNKKFEEEEDLKNNFCVQILSFYFKDQILKKFKLKMLN